MALSKKDKLLHAAWKSGNLSYKVKQHQRALHKSLWDAIATPTKRRFVINCSRRFGKSFITCLVAFEFALRNPGKQIRFAAPYYHSLKNTLFPIIRIIMADAPAAYRPKLKVGAKLLSFPNGSEIHLAGVNDGNHDSLRGSATDLSIVDEAGFVDDLHYLVKDILTPQMLTTRGTMLLVSTPSRTPDHPYKSYATQCELDGTYSKFTVYDNTSLTPDDIAELERDLGGKDSTEFKRECLCEWVVDEKRAIVPEWNDSYVGEDDPSQVHYRRWHRYTALDLGVRDLTAGLYAHYNFANATLYIDDESTMSGNEMTTDKLAEQIRAFERGEPRKLRISDNNNLMLLNDLGRLHNLPFMPVHKTSLEQMVNAVRMLVSAGRLRVSPKCQMLIGCLRNGIWNEKRTRFDNSDTFGHFDHLAALIYLVISIDMQANPVPVDYGFDPYGQLGRPKGESSRDVATIRDIFSGRKVFK